MRKFLKVATLSGLLAIAIGCSKNEDEIDTTYPVIDLTASNAFPLQCSTINRGEKFVLRTKFSDNAALGGYSIDIHHNFDHHTHSTEVTSCTLEAIKAPVKPFLLIQSYQIPNGQSAFETANEITIPTDVDAGDYHLMLKVTDKEGWQTIKGISIKIK